MNLRVVLLGCVVALSAIGICQSREGRAMVGRPWQGSIGIRLSTAAIMRQQAVAPPWLHWMRKMTEKEGPDRELLPQNPASSQLSTWPLNSGGDLPGHGGRPLFSVSTGFTSVTSDESGWMPPDTMGDVGPNNVMITINGRVKSFDKDGNLGALNADSDVFFNSVRGGKDVYDPRCRFDRLSGRWILSTINSSDSNNRICIAVSDSDTITSGTVWTFFQFQQNTVTPTGNNNQFFDYDTLGVDSKALYIGGNCFAGSSFSNSSAFVVRKSTILGAGPIVVSAFRNLIDGSGVGPWTPQGVDNDDPASSQGYLIGVDNSAFGQLDIYKVSSPGSTPVLTGPVVLSVNTTSYPTNVPASGSSRPLDPLDDRLYMARIQTASDTGVLTLWASHNISVDSSGVAVNFGTSGARTGSRWYQIQGYSGSTPTVRQSGTVFDNSATTPRHYWIPSIATNRQGHTVIGMSYAGVNDRAGAAFSYRNFSDTLGVTSTPTSIQEGLGAYNLDPGSPQRWGDYSQTSVDPTDGMSIWTFQEFAVDTNKYAVHVRKLLAPPPAAISSLSPASASPGTFDIAVTGVSTDSSGFFDPGSTFPNHLQASFSGTGIAVNSVTYIDRTHVSVNVTIQAGASSGSRSLTITNPDGQFVTANGAFTVQDAHVIDSVTFTGGSWVYGGGAFPRKVKVTLISPAPHGGLVVTLSSSNSAVANCASTMTIVGGAKIGTATITHHSVGTDTPVTFTATAGGDEQSADLGVRVPHLGHLNIAPSVYTGGAGTSVVGTVSINAPAPAGGMTIPLSSNASYAIVPASVTIPEGSTSADFNVTGPSVAAVKSPTIRATGDVVRSKVLTINPPKLGTFTMSTNNVVGGSSTVVTGTVTLNAPAPAGGTVVTLSSSNPSAASVPATVRVPKDSTSANFTVTHHVVGSQVTVIITASNSGVVRTRNLTVKP